MLGSKLVFLRRSDADAEDLIRSVTVTPDDGQVSEQGFGEGRGSGDEQAQADSQGRNEANSRESAQESP